MPYRVTWVYNGIEEHFDTDTLAEAESMKIVQVSSGSEYVEIDSL